MGDDNDRKVPWELELDDRTIAHIQLCRVYAEHYHHGAPGHLDMMTIADLAKRLDAALLELGDLRDKQRRFDVAVVEIGWVTYRNEVQADALMRISALVQDAEQNVMSEPIMAIIRSAQVKVQGER